MDAAVRKDFYRLLLKDYLAHPRTFLLSSHHLDEMEHLLEDVLLIDEGQKILHMPIDDLKEYAIGLSGEPIIIEGVLRDKQVIYQETINSNTIFAVIKRHTGTEDFKRMGLRVTAISPTDLCVYITKKAKGGIDNVLQ